MRMLHWIDWVVIAHHVPSIASIFTAELKTILVLRSQLFQLAANTKHIFFTESLLSLSLISDPFTSNRLIQNSISRSLLKSQSEAASHSYGFLNNRLFQIQCGGPSVSQALKNNFARASLSLLHNTYSSLNIFLDSSFMFLIFSFKDTSFLQDAIFVIFRI